MYIVGLEHCAKHRLIRLRTLTERRSIVGVVCSVAVRRGRVGRLKLSSVRANSPMSIVLTVNINDANVNVF